MVKTIVVLTILSLVALVGSFPASKIATSTGLLNCRRIYLHNPNQIPRSCERPVLL